jgi:hypothetical protein
MVYGTVSLREEVMKQWFIFHWCISFDSKKKAKKETEQQQQQQRHGEFD